MTFTWLEQCFFPSSYFSIEELKYKGRNVNKVSRKGRVLNFFASSADVSFIYLFILFKRGGRKSERERERRETFSVCRTTLQIARPDCSLGLLLGLTHRCWGPSTWTIFSFSRRVSRESDQKWSRWLHMGCWCHRWQLNLLFHTAGAWAKFTGPPSVTCRPPTLVSVICLHNTLVFGDLENHGAIF